MKTPSTDRGRVSPGLSLTAIDELGAQINSDFDKTIADLVEFCRIPQS